MRDPPASFKRLCGAFHQDAVVVLGGSLEAQADDCVGFVLPSDRPELWLFLEGLLARRDSSELRRVLKKQRLIDIGMRREAWWTLFGLIHERLRTAR